MEFLRKLLAVFVEPEPPRSRGRLPERELAPVADIVEQGLLVADVAVRMTVKNRLIVRALKHKAPYSREAVEEAVRQALTELAAERERDAANIATMRQKINRVGYASGGEGEYRVADSKTLRHREEVYEGVAEQLRLRAADPEYVSRVAAKAEQLAWDEVGQSIGERAAHPYYSGGDSVEYTQQREARIADLIANDLAELVRSQGDSARRLREASGQLPSVVNGGTAAKGFWQRLGRILRGQ